MSGRILRTARPLDLRGYLGPGQRGALARVGEIPRVSQSGRWADGFGGGVSASPSSSWASLVSAPRSGCAFDTQTPGALVWEQVGASGAIGRQVPLPAVATAPASGARKRGPDLVVQPDGVAEAEGGGDPGTRSVPVDPDAGAEEADALDAFLEGLGAAVEQGQDVASGYVGDYLGAYLAALCPTPDGPTMTIPPLFALDVDTQGCFLAGTPAYGHDGCCPPAVDEGRCALATVVELVEAATLVHLRPQGPDLPFGATPDDAQPTVADIELLVEALAVLRNNRDIVSWVLCLTEAYSPEFERGALSDRVLEYLDGVLPFHVTFIATFPNGATAGAFTEDAPADDGTVGVIVARGNDWWLVWRDRMAGPNTEAFCAAVAAATNLLHELVHVVGDHRCGQPDVHGACHSTANEAPWPCWDEPRMVDSAFQFAMHQRFPCLAETCCAAMGTDAQFLFSGKTTPGFLPSDMGRCS